MTTYANIWEQLKAKPSGVVLTISKYHVKTIKRMLSKHKDVDVAYKLLNPMRAKLLYKVTPVEGSPELVELTVILKQYPSNYGIILE